MMQDDYLIEIGPLVHSLGYSCSVVAGGSYSYKQSLYHSLSELRDIDLLIFLPSREKITDFLTLHQPNLDKMLHLEIVERHFSREDLLPITKGIADAIRYSGINDLGQKISVKLIAYDHLTSHNFANTTRINVLSKKDKRFYPHKTLTGNLVYLGVVNQRYGSDLSILGDFDLIKNEEDYCLGVIPDVCLSGKILYNSRDLDVNKLKTNLIRKIVDICHKTSYPKKWSDILIRSDKLPSEFSEAFCQQFPAIVQTNHRSQIKPSNLYTVTTVDPISRITKKPISIKRKTGYKIIEKRYVKSAGAFSSNSNYGLATYHNGEKTFFKELLNEYRYNGELSGMQNASAYFNNLRIPLHLVPKDLLISYDWYPGDILARQRQEIINDSIFDRLIELELKRAEDHFNSYVQARLDLSSCKNKNDLTKSRIHDVYYNRLVSTRLNDYYQNSQIKINNTDVLFQKIITMPLIINGKPFSSLTNIIKSAKKELNPSRLEKRETICGLGDAHSGNILCSNNLDDYTYIDYEFAGFHSPYLDISKQLYNDTAFNLFYSDILPAENIKIFAKIVGSKLHINHNYKPDKLSSFIFKTKMEGIIYPYQKYCKSHNLSVDKNWKKTLGLALFCCGLLTRNISKFSPNYFLLNLANSIEATDFDHYSDKFTTKT